MTGRSSGGGQPILCRIGRKFAHEGRVGAVAGLIDALYRMNKGTAQIATTGRVAWQFPAGCLYQITCPCRRPKHGVLDQNGLSSLKGKFALSVGDALSTTVEGKDDMQRRFRYSLRDERCGRML